MAKVAQDGSRWLKLSTKIALEHILLKNVGFQKALTIQWKKQCFCSQETSPKELRWLQEDLCTALGLLWVALGPLSAALGLLFAALRSLLVRLEPLLAALGAVLVPLGSLLVALEPLRVGSKQAVLNSPGCASKWPKAILLSIAPIMGLVLLY